MAGKKALASPLFTKLKKGDKVLVETEGEVMQTGEVGYKNGAMLRVRFGDRGQVTFNRTGFNKDKSCRLVERVLYGLPEDEPDDDPPSRPAEGEPQYIGQTVLDEKTRWKLYCLWLCDRFGTGSFVVGPAFMPEMLKAFGVTLDQVERVILSDPLGRHGITREIEEL